MCRRTTCRTCGKASWAGCGQHIEQALQGVPDDQRCSCPPAQAGMTGMSRLIRLFRR